MGLINWIKKSIRKNEVDSVSEMLQNTAVTAFQQRIYEYPRSYFLRKGPREIRVNTDTHRDFPFPYTTCEVIGWIQRGI